MKLTKKGVSLPELLAVIVIMGLIAMIAVPAFTSMISNTEKKTTISELQSLIGQTNAYAINESDSMKVSEFIEIDHGTGNIPFFGTAVELNKALTIDENIAVFDLSKITSEFNFNDTGCKTDGKNLTQSNMDLITIDCIA